MPRQVHLGSLFPMQIDAVGGVDRCVPDRITTQGLVHTNCGWAQNCTATLPHLPKVWDLASLGPKGRVLLLLSLSFSD
jgi:hypothetical protein